MDYRDVRRALTRKGFRLSQGSNHEIYRYFDLADQKTGVSMNISRGSKRKSVSKSDRSIYARELHLSNHEFDSLVDCSMGQDEYEKLMLERNPLL